jgi:NTP pyrophosphatase (non-canonical NTP hydrolase)
MPQDKTRHQISHDRVQTSFDDLSVAMEMRLEEKGRGTFASSHEILGVIGEEYHELVEAIKLHGDEKAQRIKHELLDIAVACVFGAACIDEGKVDWL